MLPVSQSTGTHQEAGAARLVCPILSARVSVPPLCKYLSLYVRAGPTLVPHQACAPFHRSPPVRSSVRSTFHLPSTPPATPSVSTTKSAHQRPRSPFDRLLLCLIGLHYRPMEAHSQEAHGEMADSRQKGEQQKAQGRVTETEWASNAPLLFSPRLLRMPVCYRPPHHLAQQQTFLASPPSSCLAVSTSPRP